MYIPIVIICVILCVNQVHKNLISSKNMTITMDYSEYNLAMESENKRGKYLLCFYYYYY